MSLSLITRDFIHPGFTLFNNDLSFSKDKLINMIRYWKILLWEKYNIRRGSKIGIACLEVDAYHCSLIFACSELGCQIVLLDHPISKETIHKTKAALFAPIDLGIVDSLLVNDQLHQKMLETYCNQIMHVSEFDTYKIVDHDTYSAIADHIFCRVDDPLILASTSGTTSDSKPVLYNQEYTTQLAIRNSNIFNHKTNSNVIHTRNMHHASSLLLHFFPSVYACSTHWSKYVNFNDVDHLTEFVSLLVNKEINLCLLCNHYDLNLLISNLQKNNIKFKHRIDFNISGFVLTSDLLAQIKNHNMTIVSTFGSVDTGVPVFINQIDKNSTVKFLSNGCIGYFPSDGFYKLTVINELVQIECPKFWKEPRFLSDRIKKHNDLYYHLQRDNIIQLSSCEFNLNSLTEYVKVAINYNNLSIVVDQEFNCVYLVLWDTNINLSLHKLNQLLINSKFKNCSHIFKKIKTLHKKDFTIDTKVSVDQLRGYLQSANDPY